MPASMLGFLVNGNRNIILNIIKGNTLNDNAGIIGLWLLLVNTTVRLTFNSNPVLPQFSLTDYANILTIGCG